MKGLQHTPITKPDWKNLLNLGESILNQPNALSQCRLIVRSLRSRLGVRAEVWLSSPFFPLPGEPGIETLPSERAPWIVQKTYRSGTVTCISEAGDRILRCSRSANPVCVAIPLRNKGDRLGVLMVERPVNHPLSPAEMDLLEAVAAHSAVALQVSRQMVVKNWRYEQLSLVKSVSSQVANILDMDELCRQVCRRIQDTFHFYFVAIFTQEPHPPVLRLRASASLSGSNPPMISAEPGRGMIGTVACTGEEIYAPDVHTERRYLSYESLPQTKSEYTLPLKVEDKILGILDVQHDQQNAFHEMDRMVLRLLADNIALAVQESHLYSDLQRQVDQVSTVFEVSRALSSVLDIDKLLNEVVEVIRSRFGFRFVHLFTVHKGREKVIYQAGSGGLSTTLAPGVFSYDLNDTSGIIPWVARSGKTLVANDVTTEPLYRPSELPPYDTRAELVVPLAMGGEVLGVLDIQSERINAFDEQDRSLFEALSASIAIAIRNATLFSATEWRHQVADSLREVAGLLSANTALDELLDRILAELERNLPCDASAIWLREPASSREEGTNLRLAAARGIVPTALYNVWENSITTQEWLYQSMFAPRPSIRAPGDPIGPLGAALRFSSDYSSIAAPLRAGSEPLGVLTLAHHTSGRYGGEARDMTATFASYAATAIQNARLFTQAQQQAWISSTLLQVAEATQTSRSLDEILADIVRPLPRLVGIQRCAFLLWEPALHLYRVSASVGFDHFLPGSTFPETNLPVMESLRAHKSIHFITDPKAEIPPLQVENWEHTARWVALPLLARDELLGGFIVAYADTRRGGQIEVRDQQILAILQGISHQVSLAIQNTRYQQELVQQERLDQEFRLAHQIQQSFLPEFLPDKPGWRLEALWQSASQVSGDLYDAMALDSNHLGMAIADVSDKGMPAALYMAVTRTLLHASIYNQFSPSEVLQRVNNQLVVDSRQGMFVTAIYAIINEQNGKVTFSSAGHTRPLYYSPVTGKVNMLSQGGMALGVDSNLRLENHHVKLEVGDCLILYTDGVTDTFSPEGEAFGEERLIQLIEGFHDQDVCDLVKSLNQALIDFRDGGPLTDDLTLLAVQRLPQDYQKPC